LHEGTPRANMQEPLQGLVPHQQTGAALNMPPHAASTLHINSQLQSSADVDPVEAVVLPGPQSLQVSDSSAVPPSEY
jgi:hypothetical protein